jgi:integrase
LKVKDIDFNNGCITFQIAKKRKGNPSINLRLMPELESQIRKLIKDSNLNDDDYLFIESLDSKDNFKRNLRSFLERNSERLTSETIGKKIKIGTHDFRKLRGQHLLDQGIGIERLQKLYQHEDVNTTMIYLEVEETQINNVLINDPNRHMMKYDDAEDI